MTVICLEEQIEELEAVIFRETTTIGIRRTRMDRHILEREMEITDLGMGSLAMKKCTLPNGEVKKYPEYEAAAELARNSGKALREVLGGQEDNATEDNTSRKMLHLQGCLKSLQNVAVAFSGGVDSTFLLKAAHDVLGDSVIAVTARAGFFPERELKEAEEFCKKERIRQVVFDLEESEIEGFCENPPNRCYLCKKELLKKIRSIADEQNITCVIEGSNQDDTSDYRPGMLAVTETAVKSPLKEAGLTKAEIRELSKELGLPEWDKPSFACLASRFAYGERITKEKLCMVEKAEQLLFEKGFRQARVRIHEMGKSQGNMARIEIMPEQFARMMVKDMHTEITSKLKSYGFTYVSMDLEGYRTGSMNETLK